MADAGGRRARRAAAQLLDGAGGRTPVAIVRRLLAVQAQDLPAARLALRARGAGLTAAAVDRALGEELVVAWLARGTLHLVRREDHGWLLALTAPGRMAANRRRLHQEGLSDDDAERALGIVERSLGEEGPLTRPQLAERIAARGIRTEGQATPVLLARAALCGITVLGPVRGDRQAFVPAPAAPAGPSDRDAALAELARRYLAGHGPATAADLAAWSGLGLREARAGLSAIAGELVTDGEELDLAGRAAPQPPPPRLLGAFDPYLLGWRDRSFAVPAAHARTVHPGGGILRAVATVGGRAVATWTVRRRGERMAVALAPFARVSRRDEVALEAEMDDVARFEGRVRA